MKQGTLAFFAGKPTLLPTFRRDCVYRPIFMALYLRQLRRWGFGVADEYLDACYERFSGDLVALAKGEVLSKYG